MKIILYLFMLIITLVNMLMLIFNLSSKKMTNDREKNSPFECGFDPSNFGRLPFSLQFFLITIIFIIFDVELTLLLPITLIMKNSSLYSLSFSLNFFILILILGLFHEQNQGSLNWIK